MLLTAFSCTVFTWGLSGLTRERQGETSGEPDWPRTIGGRQLERYSVITTTLRYIFVLSHNASTLWRKTITFYSYRSWLVEIVIASYIHRYELIGNIIALFSYLYVSMINKEITCNAVMFGWNVADLWSRFHSLVSSDCELT